MSEKLTRHQLQVKHNNLKQMLKVGHKLIGDIFSDTLTYIQINREIDKIEELLKIE